MKRSRFIIILAAGVAGALVYAGQSGGGQFTLAGPGLRLEWTLRSGRLALHQIQREDGNPLLWADAAGKQAGGGALGNPLSVIVRRGGQETTAGMQDFKVLRENHTDRKLLAYLQHDSLPLFVVIQVEVDGNVANWQGQVLWNGDEAMEADIFFPILSRVRFENPQTDHAVTAQTSGIELKPLATVNYQSNYAGRLAAPVFLAEGGGRGLAFVDDNRADYAPEPGAAALRGQVIGNTFPPPSKKDVPRAEQGPFLGIRYTRVFRPVSVAGGEAEYNASATKSHPADSLPIRKLGDAVDLGPVKMYAYTGSWKNGAAWARAERQWVPMRKSPAEWWNTASIMTEGPIPQGGSFRDMGKLFVSHQRTAGSDVHFIHSAADELLGAKSQVKGDYTFPTPELGGFDDVKAGMDAVHAGGGHMLFYVEGLIMWKRSRVGRSTGQEWALMEPDGAYTEHYKGYWHMCPAVKEYQEWFAKMAAEVVRSTGTDGFFIDSSYATFNHRCFNPAHHHPHPDVWNWGLRNLMKRVREEVDKVNPNTVIIFEGCGDMGREYADGFLAHSAFWSKNKADIPLVRFLYPEIHTFDSWGYDAGLAPRNLVFNAVNGYRIFAHGAFFNTLGPQAAKVKAYHSLYPEVYGGQMAVAEVACDGCMAQMFEGARPVVTAGNPAAAAVEAALSMPVAGGVLFDRVTGERVPLAKGRATVKLGPWEVRMYEVRP